MKNLILIPLVAIFITSSAQKSLSIKAGTAYSTYKHSEVTFGNSLGYLAGISFQDKFSQVLGVDADLYFLNQINTVSDLTASVRSVNAIFAVNLFPFRKGPYIILGPEVGHTFDVKFDGEDLPVDNELRFGAVFGLGYPISDKIGVVARYIKAIDHQGSGYDYNLQVGLNLKFFKR